MTTVLRAHAEQQFAEDLIELERVDTRHRPGREVPLRRAVAGPGPRDWRWRNRRESFRRQGRLQDESNFPPRLGCAHSSADTHTNNFRGGVQLCSQQVNDDRPAPSDKQPKQGKSVA